MFIDVTGVPDLNVTSATSSGLTVGAAVSLQSLIALCAAQDPMSPTYTNDPTTETVTTATSSDSALARHLQLVATRQVRFLGIISQSLADMFLVETVCVQVRSVGSWAGNLMLASHNHAFPSDVALVCTYCAFSLLKWLACQSTT